MRYAWERARDPHNGQHDPDQEPEPDDPIPTPEGLLNRFMPNGIGKGKGVAPIGVPGPVPFAEDEDDEEDIFGRKINFVFWPSLA